MSRPRSLGSRLVDVDFRAGYVAARAGALFVVPASVDPHLWRMGFLAGSGRRMSTKVRIIAIREQRRLAKAINKRGD